MRALERDPVDHRRNLVGCGDLLDENREFVAAEPRQQVVRCQRTRDPFGDDPEQTADCDGSADPGAASGITATFEIPVTSVLHEQLVYFIPPEWGVASDADIPDGTPVGRENRLESWSILGPILIYIF